MKVLSTYTQPVLSRHADRCFHRGRRSWLPFLVPSNALTIWWAWRQNEIIRKGGGRLGPSSTKAVAKTLDAGRTIQHPGFLSRSGPSGCLPQLRETGLGTSSVWRRKNNGNPQRRIEDRIPVEQLLTHLSCRGLWVVREQVSFPVLKLFRASDRPISEPVLHWDCRFSHSRLVVPAC